MPVTQSKTIDMGDAAPWSEPLPHAEPARRSGRLAVLAGLLREWRKRQRQRRELQLMPASDFRDVALPCGLADDEARRWPWQNASKEWSELEAVRRERRSRAGRPQT